MEDANTIRNKARCVSRKIVLNFLGPKHQLDQKDLHIMRTKMPEGTFNGPEKGRRERTDRTRE